MRKVVLLTCLFGCMHIGLLAAHADVPPFQINPGDLVHQRYYTWGISWTVPDGEKITSATFTISQINDWTPEPGDIVYLHLLDNPPLGWDGSGWDNQGGGDYFDKQGLFLDSYEDKNGYTREEWVYDFTPLARATLGKYAEDNVFGFGIDPDCHYDHEGISLTIDTAPIPAPAGVLLGTIGLGTVGWVRRRLL